MRSELNPLATQLPTRSSTRLAVVLGVDLSADSLDDPQQLQVELASPVIARAIAGSWLRQITAGGVSRLDQQTKDALIEELAACFRAEQGFDRTLSGWIGGQSPNASGFYQAIASGDFQRNGASSSRFDDECRSSLHAMSRIIHRRQRTPARLLGVFRVPASRCYTRS